MSNLQAKLAALPPEKRALLLKKLAAKRDAARNQIPAQPRRGQDFPLSFSQERMWVLQQLEPSNPQYNVSLVACLSGKLDTAALQAALNRLVQRHEGLRTTFHATDGVPGQRVENSAEMPLPIIDLRATPEQFVPLANAEIRSLFDLEQGPLTRCTVYRLSDSEARLVIVQHHIVSDGWSLGVMLQEWAALYRAQLQRQPIALPTLTVQAVDYACWERETLRDSHLGELFRYWQTHLGDASRTLDLPIDRPRPAYKTTTGERLLFELKDETFRGLQQLIKQENTTMFVPLFAAFGLLMSQMSGQRDIIVGTPINNRRQKEMVGVIGAFVNTLALRCDLRDNPTVRDLMQQVHRNMLDGMDHQAMPFARLVEMLGGDRLVNRSPLFQVSFGLQDNPLDAIELPDLRLELLEVRCGKEGKTSPVHLDTAMFDVTFHLSEIPNAVGGWIEFNSDLFDAETVGRFGRIYQEIVANLITHLDEPVLSLPLLDQTTIAQLNALNTPVVETDAAKSLHQLVEDRVAQTPHTTALELWHDGKRETLTYGELNARANRLAYQLRSQHAVGTETLVGLYVDRSFEMVIGALAIMKAGGGYVPLSPEYPDARLQYMAQDAGVALVLTRSDLRAQMPAIAAPLLEIDGANTTNAAENLNVTSIPDSVAYVIYTSGSTGQPKGVLVPHRNICNLVRGQIDAFAMDETSRTLQFASFSFDASVSEIFTSLVSGGTLVLSGDRVIPGAPFEELLNNAAISTVTLPPSMTKTLDPDALPQLKTLVSAGEALPWSLMHWSENRRLLNFYGPTEATVGCAYQQVIDGHDGMATVPIGRALPNAQLYILDDNLQRLPFGAIGQLAVGGVSPTRGYHRQPSKTAANFVPDPFGERAGCRLYLTGDRVRLWANGEIEFIGRIDNQVKLRGYRIDLSEIEAALRQHEAVREAVVIANTDHDYMKLIAYVEGGVSAEALRAYLRSQLPRYMVPALFVEIETWPLTSNGKIDRKTLPIPLRQTQSGDGGPMALPSNATEEVLAEIWCELLRRNQVGIHDNFFELGGDSILSIQVVSRAQAQDVHITPRDVFVHQTIAQLAVAASEGPRTLTEQGLVSGEATLTPIQRWFFAQPHGNRNHWNQAVWLNDVGELSVDLLRETVALLLAQHDALRLRFTQTEAGWMQAFAAPDAEIPVTVVDLPDNDELALALEAAATEAHRSLDIEQGPLLRVVMFRRADGASQLLFTAHHLVVDAISWQILLTDFERLVAQGQAGEALELSLKTTSFQQWADAIGSAEFTQDFAYWNSIAQQAPTTLLTDYVGDNVEGSGGVVRRALSAEITSDLLQNARAAYNSHTQELLLTALTQTMSAWTGSESVWVQMEGHGREPYRDDLDLSRTVGWFTSAYPLCLTMPDEETQAAQVIAVKEQVRAVPNSGFSYGLLQRNLPALPVPQIGFNFLGEIAAQAGAGVSLNPPGQLRAADAPRPVLLQIEAVIEHGQLQVAWHFSRNNYAERTVAELLDRYLDNLEAVIAHCVDPEAGQFTPSDFVSAELDTSGLDNIFAELGL